MIRFNQGTKKAGNTHTIGAHVNGHLTAFGRCDLCSHRIGILGAEIEDMSNLNTACGNAIGFSERLERSCVMHLVGRRIRCCPLCHDRRQIRKEVGSLFRNRHFKQRLVAKDLAFARVRENDEFVAHVATNGARVGLHWDRLQSHAIEGPQVGHEHAVIGVPRRFLVEIEGIGIFHQELTSAHDPEARPHLVRNFHWM